MNDRLDGQLILNHVKMRDVISMYDMRVDKPIGRIQCPFHNGKDKNFSYNNELFHCFVCGVKGNPISYVSQRFGINHWEAMQKIDDDFGLNIIGKKPTLIAKKRYQKKQRELSKKQKRDDALKWIETELIDAHRFLFQHTNNFEIDNEEQVEALLLLSEVSQLLDAVENLREGGVRF